MHIKYNFLVDLTLNVFSEREKWSHFTWNFTYLKKIKSYRKNNTKTECIFRRVNKKGDT